MKRISTLLIAALIGFSSQAQISEGSIALLGGFHVLNLTDIDDPSGTSPIFYNRSNQTNFDFGGMYFLTNAISVGASILVQNSASLAGTDKGDLKLQSSSAQGGARLFGRYYHPILAPRLNIFGQAYFNFLGGNQKSYDNDGVESSLDKVNIVGAGIHTGFSYFIIPAIAIELNFGLFNWQQRTTNFDNDDGRHVSNSYELFAISNSLTFSFLWYLGRCGQGF